MNTLQLGVAKTDITPGHPVPLAGYADRAGKSEGVARRLYARAWVFKQSFPAASEDAAHAALLVQADLIWWGNESLERLKARLSERSGIAPEHIMLHASHTHSGPQTSAAFSPAIGTPDEAYLRDLENRIEQAVVSAMQNIGPVTVDRGVAQCGTISVNRRRSVEDAIRMAPNPDGVNDREVTVFRFNKPNGEIKGILFHYTCHPTTVGANVISSDYCGAAMERLDEAYGDGVSCFLQGCCGDIRPAIIENGRFVRGTEQDVQRLGDKLAHVVQSVVQSEMKRLQPARLMIRTDEAVLPYSRLPAADELQFQDEDDEQRIWWKRKWQSAAEAEKSAAVLQLQLMQIADGLTLLAMNGEVVVEYGMLIKRQSAGNVLPLAYSNGMIGYVPTARQLAEGGYESIDSVPTFGLPSSFAPELEANIHAAIERLLASG